MTQFSWGLKNRYCNHSTYARVWGEELSQTVGTINKVTEEEKAWVTVEVITIDISRDLF